MSESGSLAEPQIAATAFVADGARIVGDVVLHDKASVWYNAVLRGDKNRIVIGSGTNIQDNTTVHCTPAHPLVIGDGVSVGHNCVIHCAAIGDNTLIGMGAVLLDGARIGANCIIGAGSLVTRDAVIPDGSMAYGSPAKVIRRLSDEEIESNRANCETYLALVRRYKNLLYEEHI